MRCPRDLLPLWVVGVLAAALLLVHGARTDGREYFLSHSLGWSSPASPDGVQALEFSFQIFNDTARESAYAARSRRSHDERA